MTKKRKRAKPKRRILTVDVGGTHVKFEISGRTERREFKSGPKLSAKAMVREVKRLTADWSYDVVYSGKVPAESLPGTPAPWRT